MTHAGPRGFDITPGAADSPVILHVPHGARAITAAARSRIVLNDRALSRELDAMTDAHTDLIAARAAAAAGLRPWVFANLLSRLVVDPERFPDDREELRAVGMGAVYLRTSRGAVLREDDPDHVEELLARHYRPYAAAVADLVAARLAAVGHAVIIDVHSYPRDALPYELHGTGNRPAVCLGVDAFHTPDRLRDAALAAFAPCGDLDLNTPFAGCYVPLAHYRTAGEVSALMVEIRRDGYMTEPGGPPSPGIDTVVRALTTLIDAI